MTIDELREIMVEIQQAKQERTREASKREKQLRQTVHDHIYLFPTFWDLYDFCRETTWTDEEFNGVTFRLRKTWLNHFYGKV